jgi:hypothetical protein
LPPRIKAQLKKTEQHRLAAQLEAIETRHKAGIDENAIMQATQSVTSTTSEQTALYENKHAAEKTINTFLKI